MKATPQRFDAFLFLGPAVALMLAFFVAPIVVNILVAFSDMNQTVRFEEFPTTKQFNKLGKLDSEAFLGIEFRGSFYRALALTASFVLLTLIIFNVSFALILALTTTAVPERMGAVFRAIWLLPRMSPSVVYALLWLWVVDSAERGLLNQVASVCIRATEPSARSSHGGDRRRKRADRCQPWDDNLHLGHPVNPRTSVQRCPRRWSRAVVYSAPCDPARPALADKLYNHLSSARFASVF